MAAATAVALTALSGSFACAKEGETQTETSEIGFCAIGFQGIGTLYSDAAPTMRWKFNDKYFLDVTPRLDIGDSSNQDVLADFSEFGLSLDFSGVGKSKENLNIGYTLHTGFRRRKAEDTNSKWDSWQFGFGAGPSVEYFVPTFHNLSVGASALILFSYTKHRRYSQNDESTSATEIEIAGQALTVRYYF